jgi:hypothetical protein
MAALVAAIYASHRDEKDADARDKPAHDGVNVTGNALTNTTRIVSCGHFTLGPRGLVRHCDLLMSVVVE